MVVKLMENPLKTLLESVPDVQAKTEKGLLLSNEGVLGGERLRTVWLVSAPTVVTCVRRASSGFGTARFTFRIENVPAGDATLYLHGVDNEKTDCGDTRVRVEVNGRQVFAGKSPWPKDEWGDAALKIPTGVLKPGENDFAVFNVTPDTEEDGLGGVKFLAARDYHWGWFMLRDVRLEWN